MNVKQRAHYFRDLWPAACHAQGWDPKDEAMRRDVTLEATGQTSTSALTEAEITALFNALKLLADPLSITAAIPVANVDVAQEEDARRRLRWVIERELMPAQDALPPGPGLPRGRPARPAFADAYVQRCAAGLVRAAVVAHWSELPSRSLEKLRFTLNQRRQQKGEDYEPEATPYHRRAPVRARRAAARRLPVAPRPAVAAAQESLFPV